MGSWIITELNVSCQTNFSIKRTRGGGWEGQPWRQIIGNRVERIVDRKSEYAHRSWFCHCQVDSLVVKCCSWVRSFSGFSSSDIPCFHISLISVHARDGEWKGKPTLWSLPSWDFSATSNRPVSFLEQLRRLTGILVLWESHTRLKPLRLTRPSLCGLVKVLLFSLLPPPHTKSKHTFWYRNGAVNGEDLFGN